MTEREKFNTAWDKISPHGQYWGPAAKAMAFEIWQARAALDGGAVSRDKAREPLQCLICGAKHSGWSKADLEEWQKLISPLRQQGRHPYGTQSPQQPSSERDLALKFGHWVRNRERKEYTVFVSMEHEFDAFLASRQEKN